ncbi:hypothetical protein EYF80_048139 [Liparis tanakae]|uniref:Uncharacterized protein n=1 Tax=Liparis tanakae TaxID=230148 RepID=A0A4Z2FLB1_9TELE|nr:hypothetical protein EYF80_048139 [Liparis tanakae]
MTKLGDKVGGAPAAGEAGGGARGEEGKSFDWVVSQGAEAFESRHTCLSCERPYSPWLAGIPEQRQRETERVRLRVKRKCERKVD